MKISKRIKSIREKSGLSTNKFAELLNISQPAFSRLENGKSLPRAETLIALYEKFQVDPLWLLTGQTRARIADPEALQFAEKFQRLYQTPLIALGESGIADRRVIAAQTVYLFGNMRSKRGKYHRQRLYNCSLGTLRCRQLVDAYHKRRHRGIERKILYIVGYLF